MLQKLQKDDALRFYIIALLLRRGAWFVLLYVLQNKLVWLSQQPNQDMPFSPWGHNPHITVRQPQLIMKEKKWTDKQ